MIGKRLYFPIVYSTAPDKLGVLTVIFLFTQGDSGPLDIIETAWRLKD